MSGRFDSEIAGSNKVILPTIKIGAKSEVYGNRIKNMSLLRAEK